MMNSNTTTATTCTVSIPLTGTGTIPITGTTTATGIGGYKDNYTIKLNSIENISITITDPNQFSYIKQLVPEKVYEFTFNDRTKIKTILEEGDLFDLEYAFYLALAKKLYAKTLTFEGVLSKSYQLSFEKKYVKIVQKGMRLFKELKKEEEKKKEYDEIKKRQHERYVRRKKAAKERKRKDQVNIIAEAIRLSKEEE